MKKNNNHIKIYSAIILAIASIAIFQSCKTLSDISNTLANIQKLQFKLDNVSGFRLGGINLGGKNKLSDISITDGLKLTQMFSSKSLPAEFVLNVAANNPNDGKAGARGTSATLTSFDWNLYIDDVKTVSGNISQPITVPGTGQSTIIPIAISLDLYEFFGNNGYDGLFNLALAIGGMNGSPARLKLDAKPTIKTKFGPISYPGRLTIVDKQWK